MLEPETWSDILAIVDAQIEESASLDFKLQPGSNNSIAKDVAAMTVDGGVILIGIAENDSRAVEAPGVNLSQQADRLQQVVNALVRPSPQVEIRRIPDPEKDNVGVVALIIPRSAQAPHNANGRFPKRVGPTTSDLSEPEVERLYQFRRHFQTSVPPKDLIGEIDRLFPALTKQGQWDQHEQIDDIGTMQVSLSMRGATPHPSEPWVAPELAKTGRSCPGWVFDELGRPLPEFLRLLQMRSKGALQETSGVSIARAPGDHLKEKTDSAMALSFPATLGLRTTVPLRWSLEEGLELGYRVAHERTLVRELASFLRYAGEWFGQYPPAGSIDVQFLINGFEGTVSSSASGEAPGVKAERLRQAAPSFSANLSTGPRELLDSPGQVASALSKRWIGTFLDDPEAFRNLLEPGSRIRESG